MSCVLKSHLLRAIESEQKGHRLEALSLPNIYTKLGFETYPEALSFVRKFPGAQEAIHWIEINATCRISASMLAAMCHELAKKHVDFPLNAQLSETADHYCQYAHIPRGDILGTRGGFVTLPAPSSAAPARPAPAAPQASPAPAATAPTPAAEKEEGEIEEKEPEVVAPADK